MAELSKKFAIFLFFVCITKIIVGGVELKFGFLQSEVGHNLDQYGEKYKSDIKRVKQNISLPSLKYIKNVGT